MDKTIKAFQLSSPTFSGTIEVKERGTLCFVVVNGQDRGEGFSRQRALTKLTLLRTMISTRDVLKSQLAQGENVIEELRTTERALKAWGIL